MRYSSGKTRIAGQIASAILKREGGAKPILVSLFCGGLSVETKLAPHFEKVICSDKQKYLIELYKAVQNGWIPPDELTEADYKYIKDNPDENPALTAFAGFGCSFGGKWFGGYGRHGTKDKHALERSMCEESKRALLRDFAILKNVTFLNEDYRNIDIPDGAVIYADPPYKGKMAAYGLSETFDTNEFWNWVRETCKTHHVYVSELEAPDDFEPIWERQVLRQLANCNAENFKSNEKLFIKR